VKHLENKPNVIVIVGPTASGKTSLGIKIAKELNGEIISADSMQIYKGLDVGTAKATKEEQNEIRHHLIDICDINNGFSVADYKKICYEKIDEIITLGKTPVIVGGTGLYVNAVVNNMNFDDYVEKDDMADNSIRCELENTLAEKGKEYIYNILLKLDPIAAKKIHMNNTKRIIRAIELAKTGNYKASIDSRNDLWNRNESKYNFITIYIDMPREVLYERINTRVNEMADSGVLEEAKMLKDMNLCDKNTAVQAIGYKEFFDYLDGKESLEEALDKLKQSTRRYAKRQITWFKKLNCDIIYDYSINADEFVRILKRMLYGKNK